MSGRSLGSPTKSRSCGVARRAVDTAGADIKKRHSERKRRRGRQDSLAAGTTAERDARRRGRRLLQRGRVTAATHRLASTGRWRRRPNKIPFHLEEARPAFEGLQKQHGCCGVDSAAASSVMARTKERAAPLRCFAACPSCLAAALAVVLAFFVCSGLTCFSSSCISVGSQLLAHCSASAGLFPVSASVHPAKQEGA